VTISQTILLFFQQVYIKQKIYPKPYILLFFLFILLFLSKTYFTFLPYTFAHPIIFPSLKFKILDAYDLLYPVRSVNWSKSIPFSFLDNLAYLPLNLAVTAFFA